MKRSVLVVAAALMLCASAQAKPLKGKVLFLNFSQPVAERAKSSMSLGMSGVSNNRSSSLLTLEAVLETAAKDDDIAMIFMRPDKLTAGTATTEEIRTSVLRFREKSGKRVVAYMNSINARSLYLATSADMIVLNPAASGHFSGMGSTQYFIKDLLDTLGVHMQLIRHGKYKSAGEMYIRNDISPENREQYQALLGTIWDTYMDGIAQARGIEKSSLDAMASRLSLADAPSWYEAGLVDTLMHRDQIEAYLCALMGKDKVSDIGKITPDKYKLHKGNSRNHIAVIYADGSIGSDLVGDELARTIEKVKADKNVKAVVFRVNSPGGAVMDSDIIRRAILQLQEDKLVVASYGDYAASGGYWISASASRIFCSNTTLTGSIGVFGMVPSYGDAIRRHLHVNPVVVGTHEHSDMFSGMRDLDPAELEWNQQQIETVYTNFVNLVAKGRGMTPDAVDDIAQGRVWAGATAFKIGLADERGTLLDAIKYAAKEAGLSDFRIDCYPEVKEVTLRSLLSGKSDNLPLVTLPFSEFPFLLQAEGPVYMALMESIITIY
ncbi:MAG: signal peptide peptidase SppA [Bacteroidales bacterium]|nr:signal peptide peptidase SppA [Bacteroidales bacterium]